MTLLLFIPAQRWYDEGNSNKQGLEEASQRYGFNNDTVTLPSVLAHLEVLKNCRLISYLHLDK